MSEAKRHHYISHFYLAGFTEKSVKDSKLFCFDLHAKKLRVSKPINEGYEKYFNRLESNKENPNELENVLAQLEGNIAISFQFIAESKSLPVGESFQELIYYVSLLGVRNPSIRDSFNQFQKQIYSSALSLALQNKAAWENFVAMANKENNDRYASVTYEEMKEFITSERWSIVDPNENKVFRELSAVDLVYQLSMKRNWSLYIIENSKNYFITSDRPVKLFWSNNINQSFGPTFGERNSELVFPISKRILLLGSFVNPSITKEVSTEEEIASINVKQLLYYKRYIYSATEKFILKRGSEILSSEFLINKTDV